jgi:L-ascorbate metabolism protein UlaG (beta-lactamase superfamily)
MSADGLFLKPNVQIEPLFDRWYAWAHLIPPATAARNITERHLRIMDSYLSAPEMHAAAVKNPKMQGGPFIDYGGERVDEIKQLRVQTAARRARLLELSAAISELDRMLAEQARGLCLDPLYASVPAVLRGYVELVYDLQNRPSFRLIEPLLYRSSLYDRSAQSLVLSETAGDDRPFVLSTPRLSSPDSVDFDVRFDDPVLDKLFELKRRPTRVNEIAEIAEAAGASGNSMLKFFSHAPPKPYETYSGKGVRWRYFGHACILIEAGGVTILSDPVLSYTYESSISRYTYDDLPGKIDFVVITHNHQDHILFETLLQLRQRIGTIVVPKNSGGSLQDPSLRLVLRNTGFRNVIELEEMEELAFDGGSILGLPFLGEHADLDVRSKLAYLVNIGKHRILLAADSRNIDPEMYAHVHQAVGDIDAVFLGMECDGAPMSWLYGPLVTGRIDRAADQSRRLAGSNFEQARDIVERFHPREVYVYAMGQEPWLNHIMSIKYTSESRPIVESNKLIEYCAGRGIVAERLFGEKEILLD